MTQDYKDTLLRYLTGNLSKQTKPNNPVIGTPTISTSTLGYYLDSNAGNGYEIIDILQGYQSTYSIIYGNKSNNEGFMVIIDENNDPIQYIDRYTSGTKFSTFQILNVADDGNIYGIDIKSSTPRFIMLNNVTLKTPSQEEFTVRLRQSYNLPSPLSTASKYFAITKAVGQAKYLIGSTRKVNNVQCPLVTELTINVGETNDWVNYDYPEDTDFHGQCIWATWDEDVLDFKVGGYIAGISAPFYIEYQLISGTSLGKWSMEIPLPEGYANGYYSINTVILNKTTAYVGLYDGGVSNNIETGYLFKVDYQDTDVDLVMGSVNSPAPNQDPSNRITFKIKNGIVFFMMKIYEIYGSTNDLKIFTGMILNTNATFNTITTDGDTSKYLLYLSNLYNLYNYNIIGLDYDGYQNTGINFLVQQVYNSNNFNGIPYENTNSLVPNSAVLYDSNNLILFARNLYNKSVYGNKTLSVIQIPNTMVNDVTISQQDLWGQTKKVLNSITDDFTKNIYETVYLNFYNSLLIQNRNTTNYITNMTASELLNQSVSLATDYDDMKATKYRINYIDNTHEVYSIQPTITNGTATYSFRLTVPWDNLIMSVDIISEDETTRYQTIGGLSSLDPGKIYDITQDCYVD